MLGFFSSFFEKEETRKKALERLLKLPDTITGVIRCKNPRCITSVEQELPQVFKLRDREKRIYRCLYCETQAGK